MNILKIDARNPQKKVIDQAVNTLSHGGIIMYPTDTCYGIGADMSNSVAFKKVYELKKRSLTKPVSVIVPDLKYITNIAIVGNEQKKYLEKYLPGSVTLILLTLDQNLFPFSSIGIRLPDYKITQMISQSFAYPYITTSANISNFPPAYEIKDFLNQLGQSDLKPDLILDAGILPKKELSTVVNITNGTPKILRQGSQKIEKL